LATIKDKMERNPLQSGRRSAWLLLPLALLLFGALAWASYRFLTGPAVYVNRDFMSLWTGGRALLMDLDPYDPEVWRPLRAQFGSTWLQDTRAPFPLWTFLFTLPFALLDVGWGAAAWIAFSILVLAGTLLLFPLDADGKADAAGEEERRSSVLGLLLLVLGVFTFRATLVTFLNGQITVVLLLVLALFVILMERDRPFAAGFVLAFTALKPNPFILFVPAVGLWLIHRRRWRTIAGGTAGGLFLLAASWLVQPGWLFEWFKVRSKAEWVFITPTVWGLSWEMAPVWWPLLGLGLAVIVTAALGWLIFTNERLEAAGVVSLAIATSLLITPYIWVYEHLLLLIPLFLIFTRLRQRALATGIWLLMVFVLPWAMFWIAMERGAGTLTFVIPLLTGLLFYLTMVARPASAAASSAKPASVEAKQQG